MFIAAEQLNLGKPRLGPTTLEITELPIKKWTEDTSLCAQVTMRELSKPVGQGLQGGRFAGWIPFWQPK